MVPFPIEDVWIAGGWTTGWIFAASMVVVVFRLLYKGKLRTGREVEEIRQDRDQRLNEALAWRAAAREKDKIIQELTHQNTKLLIVSEVSAHALSSLSKPRGDGSDGTTPS